MRRFITMVSCDYKRQIFSNIRIPKVVCTNSINRLKQVDCTYVKIYKTKFRENNHHFNPPHQKPKTNGHLKKRLNG